ncbi:MAG: CRTAC1 family protein [Bacteroidetes bacterium]|nr:CRTAC1 family protein [Bacteroidota bacterium]
MNRISRPIAFLALLLTPVLLAAQPSLLKRDSGTPGSHDNGSQVGWEETMFLVPAGPCQLLELYVYFDGTTAGDDTLYIVGDPSEGALPPTSSVWSYNTLGDPIVVHYSGKPGWDTVNVRAANLHYDGYDRIVVQHHVQPGGPWFAADAQQLGTNTSFLYDPVTQNSLGFPGLYYLARGDFYVRALVQYDFQNGTTSKPAPAATLVDIAKSAGITDSAGKPFAGARVSVADWNGDGWDDLAVGNLFFQNNGDGTFRNVTAAIGIQAGASVWGDFDNDGRIDCYAVNGGAGDRIYRNNGDGTFTDVTAASGFSNPYPTVMPIWFDFNHDGKLDLYIANGRTENNGQEEYFPDQLWKGNGDGTFVRVTDAAGINPAELAGSPDGSSYLDCWGASPCDVDGDGWTDIFVATYRLAPDLVYRNRHDGTFSEEGAATGLRGVPTAEPYYFGHGIGCDWGDFNNDGRMDVVVGNLGHPDWRGSVSNPSLVYRHNDDAGNTFTEVHRQMGVKFFEMNAGVVWLDLDLDGWLDLWHCQYSYSKVGTNGEPRRLSRMYLNEGPEKNFHMKDITWHTGPLIHGAWTAVRLDLDRDGDLDLVVASPTDAVKVFRNDVPRNGNWLEFRLTGSPADSIPMDAYGTTVTVYAGGMRLTRDLQGAGSGATASQNSNMLHFGVGPSADADSVVVRYQNGVQRLFTNVRTNASYTIPYRGALVRTSGVAAGRDADISGMMITSPAYDGTAFTFDVSGLAGAHEVRLEAVDLRGTVVVRKVMREWAGGHVSLDAVARVPAGTYLIRATSAGRAATAKVVVMH